MLSSYVLLSLALFPNASHLSEDAIELRLDASSMTYAENNSAYDLIEGLESNYQPGESAFSYNEAAITAHYKHLSLSVFQRYEWFTRFSADTMDLYGRTTNGLDLQQAKFYNLNLDAQHFSASGLKLGYDLNLGKFSFYSAGSLLVGNEMMSGNISGNAQLKENCGNDFSCYTGDLQVDYFYSEDALFDRKTSKPNSIYGYAFDFGVTWKNENWYVSGLVKDAISEIAWQNAPYTTASATTATVTEKNGKIKLNPVITGYEGNDLFIQELPVKYTGVVGFAINSSHTIYASGYHAYDSTLVQFGYILSSDSGAWEAKVYPQQGVLGIEYQHRYLGAGVTANPFDLKGSEILGFNLSARYPF